MKRRVRKKWATRLVGMGLPPVVGAKCSSWKEAVRLGSVLGSPIGFALLTAYGEAVSEVERRMQSTIGGLCVASSTNKELDRIAATIGGRPFGMRPVIGPFAPPSEKP